MAEKGVRVQRPFQLESLEIIGDENELLNHSAHVVRVCKRSLFPLTFNGFVDMLFYQVVIRRLNEDQAAEFADLQQHCNAPMSQNGVSIEDGVQVVRAKYVIGADGK